MASRHRLAAAVAALLTSAIVLSGCSGDSQAADDFAGTVLDPPFEVSGTPLVDTDGAAYSLTADTDKRLTLVFFGFTNCPDICGIVMNNIAGAIKNRLDDNDRDQVDVVFVTTDPARDTGPVLRDYLDRIDPDFIGLTGDLGTIVDIAKPLGIGVEQGQKLPSGGYDVTHSTQVIGIDSDDEAPVFWGEDTTSGEFAADIHTLLGRS